PTAEPLRVIRRRIDDEIVHRPDPGGRIFTMHRDLRTIPMVDRAPVADQIADEIHVIFPRKPPLETGPGVAYRDIVSKCIRIGLRAFRIEGAKIPGLQVSYLLDRQQLMERRLSHAVNSNIEVRRSVLECMSRPTPAWRDS